MSKMMQAVVKPAPRKGLELTRVPVPRIRQGEVLIKVRAASICGTDSHLYDWTSWARHRVRNFPLIQGHELCGDIVEVGAEANKRLKPGDFVSAESHIVDYGGEYFRKGMGHIAPETQIIGVDRDGAFAEYIALPWQNARLNPSDMPENVAVLKENFGNAVHVGFTVDVRDRDVLMTGCGPAGLMTLLVLKARGARSIIVSDVSSYRLDFALRLGADAAIDVTREDLAEKVRDLSREGGVDVHLEMSGAVSAIIGGLDLLRAGGHAVAFGLPSRSFEFELAELVIFKGVTLHGVVGRRLWETWDQMTALLEDGSIDLSRIVTDEYPLEDFAKAFRTMQQGECGKVVLRPNEK